MLNKKLEDFDHRIEVAATTVMPSQSLSTIDAIRARLENDDEPFQRAQRQEVDALKYKRSLVERDATRLERLLRTRAIAGMPEEPTRSRTPRQGDTFRRTRNGRLYVVVKVVPLTGIARHGRMRAPHYLCECQTTKQLVRCTQTEITRALNAQGGSLPRKGRPELS